PRRGRANLGMLSRWNPGRHRIHASRPDFVSPSGTTARLTALSPAIDLRPFDVLVFSFLRHVDRLVATLLLGGAKGQSARQRSSLAGQRSKATAGGSGVRLRLQKSVLLSLGLSLLAEPRAANQLRGIGSPADSAKRSMPRLVPSRTAEFHRRDGERI